MIINQLIYSVVKTIFKCEESEKLICRNYSNFSEKDLQSDLLLNIRDEKKSYLEFVNNVEETLDKHAPKKTKVFRANLKSHINKTPRKAITNRSQLKNKSIK